jgi:hypothetical protein
MNLLRDISQLMILTKESAPPLCMRTRLDSSAPHIHPAAEWHGAAANENALILYKSSDGAIEVGIRRWQQRNTAFFWERDILCYFMRGHGFLRPDTDGSIKVTPGPPYTSRKASGVTQVLGSGSLRT